MKAILSVLLPIVLLSFGIVPTSGLAQSVTIRSGEHDGFSRLVLQFPQSGDWRLIRTEDGYALQTPENRNSYNLTDVFQRMGRDRLSAIFADPETGDLRLRIPCNCHIIPFELRTGVIVLDINDGPAPKDTSFELSADGTRAKPLGQKPVVKRAARRPPPAPGQIMVKNTLDWRRDLAKAARLSIAPPEIPQESLRPRTNLIPMREAVLWELSRGAASGIVDMVPRLSEASSTRLGPNMMGNLKIGTQPGYDPNATNRRPGLLTADGKLCIDDEQLNIIDWGRPKQVAMELGPIRANLLGEFDLPNPEQSENAIKYMLYLGFGTEARSLITAFAASMPEQDIWNSLGHIVDGEAASPNAFEGMIGCNTTAALWAMLAPADPEKGQKINQDAVLRGFSALPLHLRRHLGPRLVDRFLARNEANTARAIRDAILRAPGDIDEPLQLMAAEVTLATDPDAPVEHLLKPLVSAPGRTGIRATTQLIMAQIKAGNIVDTDLTSLAAALVNDIRGADLAKPLASALALGLASQSRLNEALGIPETDPETQREAWSVFIRHAAEKDLLAATVGRSEGEMDPANADTRLAVASRLLKMGLPDPAHDWLANLSSDEARLLRARSFLLQNDSRSALQEIAGLPDAEAQEIRARALLNLGDHSAVDTFAAIGEKEAQLLAARRLGDWQLVAKLAPESDWAQAARLDGHRPLPSPETNDPAGSTTQPLQDARNTIGESAAARRLIQTLLNPSP
ncbi:MAG: hypothetical protein ACK5M4_11705 [Pseudorhodobacter sp.]